MKILIYGYGNPGRQDDGLGIALTERLAKWVSANQMTGVEFDYNYQLNIEDAAAIAQKDLVIFVDATTEDIPSFQLSRVDSSTNVSFTTHAASPGYILHLCKDLFQKEPLVFMLQIKGYEWAFQAGLSEQAGENLDMAFEYMQVLLTDPEETIKLKERMDSP